MKLNHLRFYPDGAAVSTGDFRGVDLHTQPELSELAAPFGMSLTGMRKHVRLLEEGELVTTEKVGRVRRCTLAPYAFEGISLWLGRLDRFAQVVERTKGAR